MYMGEEPVWDDIAEMSNDVLTKALNWYNYMGGIKEARKYLVEYVKSIGDKQYIAAIRSAPDSKITTTAGWLARMHMQGAPLEQQSYDFIDEHLEPLLQYHQNKHEAIKEENPKSIQQRLAEKANDMIGELEYLIDDFILSGYTLPFNAYDTLVQLEAKGKHSEHIAKHFVLRLDEVKAAIDKTDPDCVEAYKGFKVAEKKALYKQYKDIVDSANKIVQNANKTRKTRVKRVKGKDPNKVVSKLKYLERFDDLKLVSVHPAKIVGAAVVWLYNSKNKTLHMYMAAPGKTLTVSRSSIRDFDPEKSGIIRVGKQLKILENIQNNSKLQAVKAVQNNKSKLNKGTGRVNEHMIILKVSK